ncbi:hypothetical protein [Halobellus ruber]|uniref:Uncharacterized protein n=1 Tax=Halobellus ruber TaxID=2761102 RepID=A0A7J9SGG0_9EURY|nr:hypothetical protein [Halobellus ruber]MBB6645076.1 hypothetical protein [Halobellus ruber]
MSSDGQSLRESFLSNSSVNWVDLGEATAGAILLQVFRLLIAIPQGFGAAIESFTDRITAGFASGIDQLSMAITGEAAAAWAPFDGGVFSLLLNTVVVLAAVFVAVQGWRWLDA